MQDYNTYVRSFPQNLTAKMFGYKVKPNFTVDNEKAISTAPTVDFGKPDRAPTPATAHSRAATESQRDVAIACAALQLLAVPGRHCVVCARRIAAADADLADSAADRRVTDLTGTLDAEQ